MADEQRGPDQFDRALGQFDGLPDVLKTKPTTVVAMTPLLGNAQTYIVQTVRQKDKGDYIFLQYISAERSERIVIPAKVADVIARQRDTLTYRSRSKAGKERAAEMKAQGKVFGFQKRKKA
jgi:hypothetical protein